MHVKTLSLPRLNQLNPTLESTALKLMEEAGELAQVIGKFRGLSGESIIMDENIVVKEIARELLDVAQTAVTMMFVMEEQYGVNIDEMLSEHCEKLETKGYLSIINNKHI
ncbi:MAG TPA: MazG-like family protein [Syntrophomonadaceae bacterium]|nr:MazG-like family protein [Syntrophomonadaceae bacterium]